MSQGRSILVFKSEDGEWWWHVLGANQSDIVSDSGQGYSRVDAAVEMARDLHPDLPVKIKPPGDSGDGDQG